MTMTVLMILMMMMLVVMWWQEKDPSPTRAAAAAAKHPIPHKEAWEHSAPPQKMTHPRLSFTYFVLDASFSTLFTVLALSTVVQGNIAKIIKPHPAQGVWWCAQCIPVHPTQLAPSGILQRSTWNIVRLSQHWIAISFSWFTQYLCLSYLEASLQTTLIAIVLIQLWILQYTHTIIMWALDSWLNCRFCNVQL